MEAGRDKSNMSASHAASDPPLCFSPLSEQKRNTSLTYSNSLRELLQRKISKLEQQLHHGNGALAGPEHHGDDHVHGDGKEHHDEHDGDHKEGGDGDDHAGHGDDGHDDDHHEGDGDHGNEAGGHSLVSHTEYRTPGKTGFHSSKLDSMLNQLHLAGTRPRTFVTLATFLDLQPGNRLTGPPLLPKQLSARGNRRAPTPSRSASP